MKLNAMRLDLIRITILLVLVFILCSSTLAQTTELNARDYAVLSDFLRSQLGGKNGIDDIRVGTKGSVIGPLTMVIKPLDRQMRDWIMRDLKGITSETIESFDRCAGRQMVVKHSFDLSVEYEVALPEETKTNEALYATHRHTNGYIQFSCVGVNTSGTQAVFFLERLMTNSAVGKWIFMERDPSGNWVVKNELINWIS